MLSLSNKTILYHPVSPSQLRANRRISPSMNYFSFSSNLCTGIPIHLQTIILAPALRKRRTRDWRGIRCQPTGPTTRTTPHRNRSVRATTLNWLSQGMETGCQAELTENHWLHGGTPGQEQDKSVRWPLTEQRFPLRRVKTDKIPLNYNHTEVVEGRIS